MTIEIDITIEDNTLYIREINSTPSEYALSKNKSEMINEVCEYLHDYLEAMLDE